MAQLVEALRYKLDGGFRVRQPMASLEFFIEIFRPHYDPGVTSGSDRNEYQEYFLECKGFRCVGLTTLSPSFISCVYCFLYCLYCVLYCFVCVYLFLFVLSVLVKGLLIPSENSLAAIIIIIIIITIKARLGPFQIHLENT
jgi:hypothetical protein